MNKDIWKTEAQTLLYNHPPTIKLYLDENVTFEMKFSTLIIPRNLSHDLMVKLMEMVKVNKTITQLESIGDKLSTNCLECILDTLNENVRVKVLRLPSACLGDVGLKMLLSKALSIRNVTRLDLNSNMINQTGAIEIASYLKNPECNLESLDLSSNLIGNKGIDAIVESLLVNDNTRLESLIVDCCLLSDEGAHTIARLITNNKSIKKISVTCNMFYREGVEIISDALRNTTTLSSFNITSSIFPTQLINSLPSSSKSLEIIVEKINKYIETRPRHVRKLLKLSKNWKRTYFMFPEEHRHKMDSLLYIFTVIEELNMDVSTLIIKAYLMTDAIYDRKTRLKNQTKHQ
eukprot:TRINITY_DN383_c0_g1_i7.p1 TRINITY_DN383_c0_g1~~TRINITY_DN383_c0_g1_i7.p1  ORF type:complete len:347 (-),score=35.20 TRINITY_DN383_c0_g1_i7:141-1181(-)